MEGLFCMWQSIRKQQKNVWLLFVLLLSVGLVLNGCEPMPEGRGAPSLNFEDKERDFGQEVYRLILREAALHPQYSKQRVAGIRLLNGEWDLPKTINAMVPKGILGDVETFMRRLLPLYDDNTMSHLTQDIASVSTKASQKEDLLNALVEMGLREGMHPVRTVEDSGLLGRVLEFPKNRQLIEAMATWYLNRDGLTDDGRGINSNEPNVLQRVMEKTAIWLKDTIPSNGDDKPSLLYDILLTEDPRLDMKSGKRCAVLFANNGSPILSDSGKNNSQPPTVPFPRNVKRVGDCGEHIADDGKPSFEIRDLSRTIMASVLADVRKLISKELPIQAGKLPFPFNMAKGIRPLLGDKNSQGRFTKNSPFLNMLRVSVALLKGPKIYKVVKMFARISAKEETKLASLLALLDEIGGISDRNPTSMAENSSLMEDLLPYLQEIVAQKGMLEDVLKALQTPGLTAKMKDSFIKLLSATKKKITVQDYLDHKNKKIDLFASKVDRSQGDVRGNISLFQRVLHLLADVNRHSYKSRIKALGGINIPFIEMRIQNLSLMYLKAIVGGLSIWETIYVNGEPIKDGVLKTQLRNSLPIMGLSEEPNPEELGIFINKELKFKDVPLLGPIKVNLSLDPIKGRDGYVVREHMGDALLAGLASGLIGVNGGALRPIARVFAKYNKLELFLDLTGVLHRHWASSKNVAKDAGGKPVYPTPRTNMASTEQLLVEILQGTQALEEMETMGKVMLETKLSDDPNAELGMPALVDFIRFMVGSPKTPYKQTHMWKLLDSFDQMDQALAGPANKEVRDAWDEAVTSLSDLILGVEGKGTQAKFSNPRVPVVLTKLLERAATEIEAYSLKGKWEPKVNEIYNDLESELTGNFIPVLLDLLDELVLDKALLGMTTELIVHVLPDPEKDPKAFGEALGLIASVLAPTPDKISVPIAHFLGQVIGENRPMVTKLLAFVKRTLPLDPDDQFIGLMKRSMAKHPTLEYSLMGFMPEMVKTFYRLQPGSSKAISATDYKVIFEELSRYLTDKEHGLEKLYKVVKDRNGAATP